MADTFGAEVARFYRDATIAFWRHNLPQLHSEGFPFYKTAYASMIGLVGLGIEFHETANRPNTLTPEEVVLACRYASFELNGFPIWFPRLFEAYPEIVSNFLLTEIQYELSVETSDAEVYYLLSDVSWSGQWAWDYLAPTLLAMLLEKEPVNSGNLAKMLKIIQGSSLPDSTIAALAHDKCLTLHDASSEAQWLAVWTGVDPDQAISRLLERLTAVGRGPEATDFAMAYVTQLFGRRTNETGGVRDRFQHSATHLKPLYLLMNEHICREDDIERGGEGFYSPGLRDNAQEARDHLFELLSNITGKAAYLALKEIADANPDRPWLTSVARNKAETEGDLDVMTPSQIREFHNVQERTPANHRQLAELAQMRLLDLKDDLEDGDSSIASILQPVQKEVDMRKYIGQVLRDKAFGRYNVPQEEELADSKKPDLRFHGVGFDAPVPIELKLADNWTGPQLFERLENQLCGDYLRDSRSKRGIFLLLNRGKQQNWKLPNSSRTVHFAELIKELQQYWNNFLDPQFPEIDRIEVIGIDLTRRNLAFVKTP